MHGVQEQRSVNYPAQRITKAVVGPQVLPPALVSPSLNPGRRVSQTEKRKHITLCVPDIICGE